MRTMVRPCRRMCAALAAAAASVVVCLLPAVATAEDCPYADAQAGQASKQALADATVCLVNEQRLAYGRRPLKERAVLATTASKYARHMVAAGRFGHVDESG